MGCDGWGSTSRLTIYIANSPIIIDHHRSPTLREAIDFSITSHFQMASTVCRLFSCDVTAHDLVTVSATCVYLNVHLLLHLQAKVTVMQNLKC